MGQALYRKYRSKNFAEIIGQEHITTTLDQAIKTGRISHAYLLTGPRGVGKTSVARILAHAINNLPYTDDSSHLDIIEIDAASNRRIDEIRDLREKVYVAPTSATYKVYIIDEVHMLTREAFNALLKTLEEPPAHVVFVLATTDAHKLPDTIISRTQRFSFKPVEPQKVIDHLRTIATQEGITIDDDALAVLATHGEGSFRDSISLLDQASSNGKKVTQATVQALLGIPPRTQVMQLIEAISQSGTSGASVASQLNAMYEQGFQAGAIAKQLGQAVREQYLAGSASLRQPLELLNQLLDVPAAHNPERYLEILLLKAAAVHNPSETPPADAIKTGEPAPKAEPTKAIPPAVIPPVEPPVEAPEPPVSAQKPVTPPAAKSNKAVAKTTAKPATPVTERQLDDTVWQEVIVAIKQKHNTLYGVVRTAEPAFRKGVVTLSFAFAFHQKRLSDAKNQQKLADIIYEVTGQHVKIECKLDPNLKGKSGTASKPSTSSGTTPATAQPLSAISNIFGGGELLE